MRRLQLVERSFHFRASRHHVHPPVVEIVIIAEPLPLLRIGPRVSADLFAATMSAAFTTGFAVAAIRCAAGARPLLCLTRFV